MEEAYSENKRHDGFEIGEDIINKLHEGKYKSVGEVRRCVEEHGDIQVRFWIFQNILWFMINRDTSTIQPQLVQSEEQFQAAFVYSS